MQCDCIVIKDSILQHPIPLKYLWNGKFSVAYSRGSIVKFIEECLQTKSQHKIVTVIPCSDGNLLEKHMQSYIDMYPEYTIILGTLGQVVEDSDKYHYLYLPLDDDFFDNGVLHYFPEEQRLPWSNRIGKAYWRGSCSGGGLESARVRTVANLIDFPFADVRLNVWWSEGKNIPEHFFAARECPSEFMKYKMNLIIDGNVIASSHMWAFASGAVPILVSNATCWFSRFLIPFVNYIPILYDLSDLQEKIKWILDHDNEAEQIAKNALEFARTFFSAEFQRKYIREEIEKI